MELSSDHGRYDGDFDIDIDQGGDFAGDADLDQMQEDLRSDRGMTDLLDQNDVHTNDDEMAEESIDGRYEPQDGIMQDEGTTTELNDEDLEDYIGDESEYAQERSHEDLGSETVAEQELTTYTEDAEDIGDTTLRPDEHVLDSVVNESNQNLIVATAGIAHPDETQQATLAPVSADLPAGPAESHSSGNEDQQQQTVEGQNLETSGPKSTELQDTDDAGSQTITADALNQDQEEHNIDQEYQKDDIVHSVVEHDEKAVDEVEYDDELGESKSPVAIDEIAQSSQEQHAGSFTVTGLHPTIVRYENSEIALFPSGDPTSQDEYFLEDENIVNGSIGDMLEACRVVLGGDISEDEELELTVEELGLSLSEDSTPAFSASFSEILQLYVKLQTLDGVAQPPPMYMTLSTKTRFTNRLTLLAHAVSEGRGLSSIPPAKEMMYDEEETFTEYHDYEEGDPEGGHEVAGGDDVNEAQQRQSMQDSQQIEESQPLDQSALGEEDNEGDQLHAALNNEQYQTGQDEHSTEQSSEWEEGNIEDVSVSVEEPVIGPSFQPSMSQSKTEYGDVDRHESKHQIDYSDDDNDLTPTSALDNAASAADDVITNGGEPDNDNAQEELNAAKDAGTGHALFNDEQTGDTANTNEADTAGHGPDEIDFGDDVETENQVVKPETTPESKEEALSAQENIATGVRQEQDNLVQSGTTDTGNDDLPPIPEDDLDDIDFDDDEIDNVAETKTTSLKRSFTEHNGDQATPIEDQDAKRVRP